MTWLNHWVWSKARIFEKLVESVREKRITLIEHSNNVLDLAQGIVSYQDKLGTNDQTLDSEVTFVIVFRSRKNLKLF